MCELDVRDYSIAIALFFNFIDDEKSVKSESPVNRSRKTDPQAV